MRVVKGHVCIVIDSGLVGSTGGVPREQKMLKGRLPRVIYHQVHQSMKMKNHVSVVNSLWELVQI